MQNVYAFAWSYDAVGNRHWQNRLGTQSYFSYNAANALTKSFPLGGTATYYSYDPNGNCTKIFAPNGSTYFAYNSVNLMTQVTFRNGVTDTFSYDALNRRRALVDSNGPAYFMYDRDGLCQLVERNSSGGVAAEYTRGSTPIAGIGDAVAAKINTSTTAYYQYPVYDHRGSLERIVNAAGTLTGSFEYNAWGEKLLNQPPSEGTRFSFSAPAWMTLYDDPDNGLLISPTRCYDAVIGRFMQKDPLGFNEGMNLYLIYSIPFSIDPFGMATEQPQPWRPKSFYEYRAERRVRNEAERGCTEKNSKKPDPKDCKENECILIVQKTETYTKANAGAAGVPPHKVI